MRIVFFVRKQKNFSSAFNRMIQIAIIAHTIGLVLTSTPGPTMNHWHDEAWGPSSNSSDDIPSLALIHTTTITPPPYDPCRALCEEFSADRRGDGFDLCDRSVQSQCVRNLRGNAVCLNLFWSNSQDSGWGLVYAIEFGGLSINEIGMPVLCQEADDMVYNEFNISEFNRTSSAYHFYHHMDQDPCHQLCLDFAADFRGHGQNLCPEQSSRCVNAANELPLLCTDLYRSPVSLFGLAYSTELVESPRLTCDEAQQMVDAYDRVYRTKTVASALYLLVHLSPVENLLETTQGSNAFLEFLREYKNHNNGSLPSNLNRYVHNHAHLYRTVFQSISSFMDQLNMTSSSRIGTIGRVHNSCCGPQDNRINRGVVQIPVPPGNTSSVIPFTQLLMHRFVLPSVTRQYCNICHGYTNQTESVYLNPSTRSSPIVVFNIHHSGEPRNISFPIQLDLGILPGSDNLDNTQRQLVALIDTSNDVYVQKHDQWFHTINNTLVQTNISSRSSFEIVFANITTAFYQ